MCTNCFFSQTNKKKEQNYTCLTTQLSFLALAQAEVSELVETLQTRYILNRLIFIGKKEIIGIESTHAQDPTHSPAILASLALLQISYSPFKVKVFAFCLLQQGGRYQLLFYTNNDCPLRLASLKAPLFRYVGSVPPGSYCHWQAS